MGWSRISSIDVRARKLSLVKCSQAYSDSIKKSPLFCFCKFSCLLELRICLFSKKVQAMIRIQN